MKNVKLKFSIEAQARYVELEKSSKKQEKMLLSSIQQKEEILKKNSHHGNPIAKRLIPQRYKLMYNIKSLFRIELPLFWRLLYTIRTREEETTIFVLDILSHKEYDKLFNYRKK